ncbi:MAG: NnrU family protein [Woeseia sp.]
MGMLVTGLLVFFGVHAVPMLSGIRAALVARLGEPFYKGLFSIASLAGFVLIVPGFSRTPVVPLWLPPPWSHGLALLVMPAAFILLVAAYIPGNIRRITRHPMLAGIFIWAVAHLIANGDLASLLLFGTFTIYAVIDMLSASFRTAAASRPPGRSDNHSVYMDAITIVVGLALFLVVWQFHGALFGAALAR